MSGSSGVIVETMSFGPRTRVLSLRGEAARPTRLESVCRGRQPRGVLHGGRTENPSLHFAEKAVCWFEPVLCGGDDLRQVSERRDPQRPPSLSGEDESLCPVDEGAKAGDS